MNKKVKRVQERTSTTGRHTEADPTKTTEQDHSDTRQKVEVWSVNPSTSPGGGRLFDINESMQFENNTLSQFSLSFPIFN